MGQPTWWLWRPGFPNSLRSLAKAPARHRCLLRAYVPTFPFHPGNGSSLWKLLHCLSSLTSSWTGATGGVLGQSVHRVFLWSVMLPFRPSTAWYNKQQVTSRVAMTLNFGFPTFCWYNPNYDVHRILLSSVQKVEGRRWQWVRLDLKIFGSGSGEMAQCSCGGSEFSS